MGAAIVQHADRAVAVAHHDDRLAGQARAVEIAWVFHLAVMADEQPGAPEQAPALGLENVGIGVDAAVDAVRLDQRGELPFRKIAGHDVHGGIPITDQRSG